MTMTTTRKRRAPKPSTDNVTVTVEVPHLVYHDGEQRSGTLTDVPADTAEYWANHGWATIVDDEPAAKAKPEPKPGGDK